MATIPVLAGQVRIVEAIETRKRTATADVDITEGQVVYKLANGKVGLARANAAGTAKPYGIASKNVAAKRAGEFVHYGGLAGFDLSGTNPGTTVYLSSATAGAVDNARTSGSGNVVVPIAVVDNDTNPNLRRFLWVDFSLAGDPVALP